MPSLTLLNITPEIARQLQDAPAFERWHGVTLGDEIARIRDVVQQNEAFRHLTGAPTLWGAYLAIDVESRQVVGTCGFKGVPAPTGEVEIAYYTFPAFEGRGVGTAMAAELVAIARRSGARGVIAHTLPEPNASTRILGRLGFAHAGTVVDPEDGPVWRWEQAREAAGA